MQWQPHLNWQQAQQRAHLIRRIRDFFQQRNVIEVETPLLSQGTITDVYLDAFSCRYGFLAEQPNINFYLQTSPEFAMKRLLASGYQSIFQICKAFRDEPHGSHHNPEFTMLEWYRIGFCQQDLIEEVGELLCSVLAVDGWHCYSYQEIFIEVLALDPLTVELETLKRLLAERDMLSDWLANSDDFDTLLQFTFTELIEPKIGLEKPCFVYNFPASQASLAQINKTDPRVAERFECYYRGLELVNGFHELTDANEQRARFEADNRKREQQGLPQRPLDERFLAALSDGLPDCSGVALGVDRLIMLALERSKISQVLTFDIERA